MEWESLEDELLTANPVEDCDGVAPVDSKAAPVVVLSSIIALCGSLSVGCSTGFSSPAESGIILDLGLSVAARSVFGSILTAGGIAGSLVNGKIADVIGRRGTLWFSGVFTIAGWIAIAFVEVLPLLLLLLPLISVAVLRLREKVSTIFPFLSM